MRTIFITLFQGVEARNILRTDIYRELVKQPDLRLVLFTNSQEKKEYYQKEFSGPNVQYEVAENYQAGGSQKFFAAVRFNLINTSTIDVKRELAFQSDRSRFKFIWRYAFNRLLAHRPVRRLVRWLDWVLVRDRFFAPYFEKYRPDLVFSAHLFGGVETALVREARRRGVPSVGLINSWDKLTARAMIRLLPDWLIVHNELVKRDAMQYADVPEERIFVSGVPHFDFYFNEPRTPRETFFRAAGLDPRKKTILYLPVGRTATDDDADMLEFFDQLLSDSRLRVPAQVVVRFPPNDEVVRPASYKNPITFQTPGRRFSLKRGTDWDMNTKDLRSLFDTVAYADVVIGYPSTMMVDAAIFDKPIINIKFERRPHPRNFVLWAYRVDHYQPVLATGAVRVVESEAELVDGINQYLANPELDREGRRRLSEAQCYRLDGGAGKRVADFLIQRFPGDTIMKS